MSGALASTGSFEAGSAEAMQAAARGFAAGLRAPARLVLTGPLGAGKTTFVQGLAEGLGVARKEEVASPSYTLIHEYRAADCTLFHVDLYRLDTGAQIATLGLDDLLAPEAGAITVIEWGEKIEGELPLPYLKLEFAPHGAGRRVAWRTVGAL